LSVTETRGVTESVCDLNRAWRVHPQVALRDESFGALAYHYGTRRLLFLKSRTLVQLVESLEHYDSAEAAVSDLVSERERPHYRRALSRLADSEVIRAC